MVEHMKEFPKCPKFGAKKLTLSKKENKNSSEENSTPEKDATTCDDIKNYACKYKKCDQTFSRESSMYLN